MGLFDGWRKKWKHPDPAVRLEAVRRLNDPALLGEIATNDSLDEVRATALALITDQMVLEQLACSDLPCAGTAAAKVTDPARLARIARRAAQAAVRLQAVERVTDQKVLLPIAALDPEATIRARARNRAGGPDPAWHYLRGTIAQLPVAPRGEPGAAEFSGTLDEICQTLTQDPRFFINGEVVEDGSNGTASLPDPTQAPWTIPNFPMARTTIRFLAQTRTPWLGGTRGPDDVSFYHVKVWRTDADHYAAVAIGKQTAPMSDPVAWSRASGSASGQTLVRNEARGTKDEEGSLQGQ